MTNVTATNKTKKEYIEDKARHFNVMEARKDDEAE